MFVFSSIGEDTIISFFLCISKYVHLIISIDSLVRRHKNFIISKLRRKQRMNGRAFYVRYIGTATSEGMKGRMIFLSDIH